VKSWRFLANSMEPNVRYETEFVYTLEVQRKNGQPVLPQLELERAFIR
jgi:hypothetical protein